MSHELCKITELIHNCSGLLIGAGAGMGVDSGLPDFRGKDGFWRAYPPLTNWALVLKKWRTQDGFPKIQN